MPSGGWLGLRLTYEGRGKLRKAWARSMHSLNLGLPNEILITLYRVMIHICGLGTH